MSNFIKLIKSSLLNKNSLGEPISNDPQVLQNFWNWFGDSKMIDKQGQPIVFYHVTYNNFDTFKPVIWKGKNIIPSEEGRHQFYFSKDRKWVDEYSKNEFTKDQNKNKKIISVYLHISNPFIISSIKEEKEFSWWLNFFRKYNINFTEEELDKISRYGKGNIEEFEYSFWEIIFNDTNIVKNRFKEAGYDGIILGDIVRSDYNETICVFDSNQIKSVSSNINYNKKDNSIYGSKIK